MTMPDRAIIPLFAAVATGFIGGTIGAVTQTFSPGSVIIGLVLGALVFGRGFVSAMRGACAAACFGFLFAGLLAALRDGKLLGFVWLALAVFFGVLLTQ